MTHGIETKQLRTFGVMVGGIFALIGVWPMLVRSEAPQLWAVVLGGILAIPACVYPKSLAPVYRLWMVLGEILGWINTRIILGIIYYGLFTPIRFMRQFLLAKDAMRRRFEPEADTYRIKRQPRPGAHMTQQF